MKISIKKTIKMMSKIAPMFLGIILLITIVITHVPSSYYKKVFTGTIFDPIIGAIAGSIIAGNPINSYIIGGELLNQGVSMESVIAFMVAWVAVGIVQLPAESMLLGKKFAIVRNALAFVFTIAVALITSSLLGVI